MSKDTAARLPTCDARKQLVGAGFGGLAGRPAARIASKVKLLRAQRRCEEAIPEFEIALALDRN